MNSLTVKSPAKINLILHVLGRRRDGYHRIVTLFHRISLVDDLRIRKKPHGIRLRCSDPRIPSGESNLITKAYRLLQKEFPKIPGVSVSLKKRIPAGAGLGGGSSNAASFLLAMKKRYGLALSRKRMMSIGKKLGADVPFFLDEANQGIGTGRGDRIRRRPAKKRQYFVLVLSNKGLSTQKVYRSYQRVKSGPSLTKVSRAVTMLCEFLENRDLEQIAKSLHNDLEASAFRLRPFLRKIITQFKRMGIPAARMSGSGPTIFAVVSGLHEARRIARRIRKCFADKKVVVCHTW